MRYHHFRFNLWLIGLCCLILGIDSGKLLAKEYDLGILYTSNTNGYIFPCDCSTENLGGLARRASVFKTYREKYPESLLYLDAGNFHSSYPKEISHDKLVAEIARYLNYDARNIGEQDLVYGKEFFLKHVRDRNTLSINLAERGGRALSKPFMIKKKCGFRVAILGLLTKNAYSVVSDSIRSAFELKAYQHALKQSLEKVQKYNPDLVILLLRALDYNLEFKLAQQFKTIDLILTCTERFAIKPAFRVEQTIIASAGKDGERVGKLLLKKNTENGRWSLVRAEHIRLNEEIHPNLKLKRIIQTKKSR